MSVHGSNINRILHLARSKSVKSALSLLLIVVAFWISGIDSVWSQLANFPISRLGVISALLTANLWLVGFRYWRLLIHFSCPIPYRLAAQASVSGHFAGLLLSSLPGQVVGRQAVTRGVGIPPTLNSILVAYERFLILIISGFLAVISASYLLGGEAAGEFVNRFPLVEIALLFTFCLVATLKLEPSSLTAKLYKNILTTSNLASAFFFSALTLVSQFLVLGAFVLAILSLKHDVSLVSAFAAAACISFAASMPVSVNGWGVREIASVYLLNRLGISAGDALTISILIGIISTLVILAAYLILPSLNLNNSRPNSSIKLVGHVPIVEKMAAWLLGAAVAFLIFFQVNFQVNGGLLSINLADPFAILSLATVALSCLKHRSFPQWRFKNFNKIIIAFSGILIVAFLLALLKSA